MDEPIDHTISVQKLYETEHFDTILRYNLEDKNRWKPFYPNHEQWITGVINKLKVDPYSRVVFGGFYNDNYTHKSEFCCSAIVKKNPFTPYLEIKNLLVFKYKNQSFKNELLRSYQLQLISHIVKFAEQRGFPRLVIELSRRRDGELIKIFLDSGFNLSGTQMERYKSHDEIVFLVYEVNQLYGNDPYDNYSTASWILSKYMSSDRLKIEEQAAVSLIGNNDKQLYCPCYYFHSGTEFSTGVRSKFNIKNLVIVLQETLKKREGIDYIREVQIHKDTYSKIIVFDFTKEKLLTSLTSPAKNRLTIIERDEINSLIERASLPNKQYRFDYENIGGLLLISNPKQFNFLKAERLLRLGKSFIYLKLGDYGSFLSDDMPIVFAYYPERSQRTSLHVWGIGHLSALPIVVDVNELKESMSAYFTSESGYNRNITDGHILFNFLQDHLSESDDEQQNIINTILWDIDEFNKHNNYNEKKQVICFVIKKLQRLDAKNEYINLNEFLDVNSVVDVRDIFDFYLSKVEVQKMYSRLAKVERIPPKTSSTQHEEIRTPVSQDAKPKIVILTAIKEEYMAVREQLSAVVEDDKDDTKYEIGYFIFEDVEIRVVIRECGKSNSIASQETEKAINYYKPSCLLFVGIAGSRKPLDFKLGDVIVAQKIYSYEGGKDIKNSFVARPELENASYTLCEEAKTERNKSDWKVLIKAKKKNIGADLGIIASGEKLIEHYDSDYGKILTEHYNDTSAVETEGFGFAKVASRQGIATKPVIIGIIRGISDILSQEANEQALYLDKRPHTAKTFASKTAAAFAFWMIYKLVSKSKI
jgi:nucleoside phosphorylase